MSVPFGERVGRLYRLLLAWYGPQGWWPMRSRGGYHPRDYRLPESSQECFEVWLGAILTQNTRWSHVEPALERLHRRGLDDASSLSAFPDQELASLVRGAGCHNQKAKKLKEAVRFFLQLSPGSPPERQLLLKVWGIGSETADSILLYAYAVPSFVVDRYTTRILTSLGWIEKNATYREIQRLFEEHLPQEAPLYQEYHALLVKHAKEYYGGGSRSQNSPLQRDPLKEVVW